MSEFRKFKRSAVAEMREVTKGDIESYSNHGFLHVKEAPFGNNVSVSDADKNNGSPKLGDWIARNPEDHFDQWLVDAKYFSKNFEQEFVPEVMSTQIPDGETAESMSKKINNTFQHDGMKKDYQINLSPLRSDKDFNGLLLVGKGTFGMAIEAVKHGKKVARAGWNGKDMFVYYVPAAAYPAMTEVGKEIAKLGIENKVQYREYLALKTAQGDVATWSPSGSDALAEDWMIVE